MLDLDGAPMSLKRRSTSLSIDSSFVPLDKASSGTDRPTRSSQDPQEGSFVAGFAQERQLMPKTAVSETNSAVSVSECCLVVFLIEKVAPSAERCALPVLGAIHTHFC